MTPPVQGTCVGGVWLRGVTPSGITPRRCRLLGRARAGLEGRAGGQGWGWGWGWGHAEAEAEG